MCSDDLPPTVTAAFRQQSQGTVPLALWSDVVPLDEAANRQPSTEAAPHCPGHGGAFKWAGDAVGVTVNLLSSPKRNPTDAHVMPQPTTPPLWVHAGRWSSAWASRRQVTLFIVHACPLPTW